MQIFITKDGERLGPYAPAEVNARIASGQLGVLDMGWHVGLPRWLPLSDILTSLSTGAAFHSGGRAASATAKTSFIIGLAGLVIWFGLLVAAAVGVEREASEAFFVVVGLCMFAGLGANLLGAILGIVGLVKPTRARWMGITGLLLNGGEAAGMVGIMILGAAMGG